MDETIEREPAPKPPVATTPGFPFDLAVGVAFTTDYVSRGITQSDSDPAIQGYIKAPKSTLRAAPAAARTSFA